jgi:hypothetical protein
MELCGFGRVEWAALSSYASMPGIVAGAGEPFCCARWYATENASGGGDEMPRYFFDLVDDKKVYDKKGVSLPNDKAARLYARTFAHELMQTQPQLLGESWQAWSVQVCNGKFDRIMKIPFSEIVESKS